MSERKVVVTGLGTLNALGTNVCEFWANCLSGETSVSPIPEKWNRYAQYNSKYWSPLPDIDYTDYGITKNEVRQSDPASLLAAVSVGEALENGGVESEIVDGKLNMCQLVDIDPYRSGVFIGTGQGGLHTAMANESHQILALTKKRLASLLSNPELELNGAIAEVLDDMHHPLRANYFSVGMSMPNSTAANLGIKYALKGANETYAAACASGTIAIGKAFRAIRSGRLDFAICGGTDYLYDEYGAIFRGFDIPKALTTEEGPPDSVSRPFDEDRSGFLFSQGGAGLLVIEDLEHATRRNAAILVEITGYEETFDAYNIMMPEPDGSEIRTLLTRILDSSGVVADEIDYINAHGTGTAKNDPIEAQAFADVFGKKPCINSTKSLIGHTIGASGAIEAIVSVKSIGDQTVHVSKNLEKPIMDLNFATETRELPVRRALSLSYAFGGHNGGLLFSAFEG